MNRIESAPKILSAPVPTHEIPASLCTRTLGHVRQRGREIAPHATFAPIHYEPGYAYPLVIWLHSAEGDERQIRQVMPKLSMRNYVAIAPRGTSEIRTDEICLGRRSYGWRQSADSIDEAESRVLECIGIASERFNVHAERVFLAGVGCGGTMALRTAWNHPGRFAGVASIGGALPNAGRPMRNVNALRALPCFMATGRTSEQYPEAEVCRDLRLMHSAGCTVALRQYPCGDDLTTAMLDDLNRWIMGIVCPQ